MFVEHEKRIAVEPSREVGKLKLSEAIRIGCAIYPEQCKGVYYKFGAACVWGAAAAGLGREGQVGDVHATEYDEAEIAFKKAHRVTLLIANDTGWTREQIADWLESRGY